MWLIGLPWLCLMVILICYILATDSQWYLLFLPFAVLVIFFTAFTVERYKKGRIVDSILGLLCIVACICALVIAIYAETNYLDEYVRLSRGASYLNVYPSDDAAGRSDATTISFSNGTTVDSSRTYGYYKDSVLYCIAPITNANNVNSRTIQFWAAGIGCCGARSDFSCGELGVGNGGGITMPLSNDKKSEFDEAIRGAESWYHLQANYKSMLLKWTADPTDYQSNLWSKAFRLFFIFGAVYLALSCLLGCTLQRAVVTKQG